jgi:hypothetical protein
MNMPLRYREESLHHQEQALLERALAALQETTGLTGKIIAAEPLLEQGVRVDAAVEIDVAGQPHRYRAEIKRIDRFTAIGQVRNRFDSFQQPGLLVAPRITAEMADKCRELDVQFIDANGNAYLHDLGLFIFVKGLRPRAKEGMDITTAEPPRAGTATALRVIFVLLCRPELVNAPYREINRAAGVALGTVGEVFLDLNNRGYAIIGKGMGERRILERKRLIDEWVTNYPIKLRPKLNPRRFHAPTPDWWRQVDVTRYGAQWGGEVAADKLTGYLRPNTFTLYFRPENVRQNLTKLVVENKLRADPKGEIEVLDAFWNFPADDTLSETVPPILVYADLLATLDPRNLETAHMIYEQSIDGSGTQG